jgi:ankyrin repeat protein
LAKADWLFAELIHQLKPVAIYQALLFQHYPFQKPMKERKAFGGEVMMLQLKRVSLLLVLFGMLTGCRESLKTEEAALLASARTGHSGTVRDMIASGANVNVTDEQGNTALIEAARNGHDDVVRTLLVAGANVKMKNDDGKTALMLAAQGGHEDTALLLRQSGAAE